MVIQIIYQFDIIPDKTKNYTPVSIDPYRKESFLFAGQRVQPVAGKIVGVVKSLATDGGQVVTLCISVQCK